MAILRKSAGAAVIAALLATSATPALARGPGGWNSGGWGGHYGGWRHRRDRGGISGGDVLAGILIIGGVGYLFLRGMCGPATPVVAGSPTGVFCWRPPWQFVSDVSDLLAGSGA